ncbi:MAG: DUF5995 family protein, partial [Actinomycetota bacterium]|nr:DUF5995 family protein [Actinomycetota bacterium]
LRSVVMARWRNAAVGVGVVAVALAAGSGAAPAAPPGASWTEYLAALPSPSQTHPNRIAHCRRAKLKCVRVEIRRMRRLQQRLGCDHRAVFATTYLELTRTAFDALVADPQLPRFKRFFFREDALFANVYFRTVRRWEQGREVPEAWRIAFETAESGEVLGSQDMLLGINAHVQNDMPFVLAQLGLRDRKGHSRKVDHDRFNEVLAAGYERVVAAVRDRYDPSVGVTNPPGVPADNVAGLELVREWREQVWRNAERLVNAESDAERQAVADDIEAYAGDYARGIAATQSPGYRAQRDAYCEQQLGG